MVTKPIACAFWSKFASAPAGWLRKKKNESMIVRAVALVRMREGDVEADALKNLVDAATALDVIAR